MAKMNHTPTAMSETDQHDCALTEEDIYHQHICTEWQEGLGRKELHSVSRCYTICLANQKNFRQDSQYLHLQHSDFSHKRIHFKDKDYPCLTLWHLLFITISYKCLIQRR
jgi:hypothetical protein